MKTELGAFFAFLLAMFVAGLSAAVVAQWLSSEEYERGLADGRLRALAQKPVQPRDCVAWWFQGDPVRADRNLRAACAARKVK